MKALSLLTLAMHLVCVQVLVGSLVAVLWFTIRGAGTNSPAFKTAAYVLAKRSTLIMTYVINLGIPPLLFAQVLYGRALYTSSDLIAAFWISIIPMLMACYWLLYRVVDRTQKGANAALPTLLALGIAMSIGRILSYNMTLMLRPDVWHAMYMRTATGTHLPPHDPTSAPRWGFVMIGSLLAVGLWMILNSNLPTIEDDAKALLRRTGGGLALLGCLGEIALGYIVFQTQPSYVQHGLLAHPLYRISAIVWAAGAGIAALLALTQIGGKAAKLFPTILGCVAGFAGLGGAVIVRDGIRDLSLLHYGFNVYDRHVVSNWSVVGLFFATFVISIVVIGWLANVMRQAKPIAEQVA